MLTFDINAHAAAQGNWALCYEQLYGGSFRGELTMVQLDGLRMFGEKTNLSLRQRGRLNPLWESMYQKPLAAWLERQVDLLPSAENVTALRTRHLQALQVALALAQDFPDASSLVKLGVRRSLRQAGHQESVQDVTTRWGFWHQGQCSLDYKKHSFRTAVRNGSRAHADLVQRT